MARLLGRIASTREWYSDLSLGEKGLISLAIGNVIGAVYGTHVRRSQMKNSESDCLVATTYMVPEENMKAFEIAWSDSARLAQRNPGYEWTRTFKALDWEDSPFHYISFRMWSEVGNWRWLTTHNSTWKELMKRMDATGAVHQSSSYEVIVDDSVRRIIH